MITTKDVEKAIKATKYLKSVQKRLDAAKADRLHFYKNLPDWIEVSPSGLGYCFVSYKIPGKPREPKCNKAFAKEISAMKFVIELMRKYN